MSEATNAGVGNEESDPAKDQNSPNEAKPGDAKRNKEGPPIPKPRLESEGLSRIDGKRSRAWLLRYLPSGSCS